MSKEITCQICNKSFKPLGIPSHLNRKHNIGVLEYFNTYMKTENEGICLTCGEATNFVSIVKGYSQYCSKKCANCNKDKIKKGIDNFKQTIKENPAIMKDIHQKRRKTLLENPEIMEKKIEQYKQWCIDNPDKIKERNEKYKQWCIDNPEKVKEKTEKRSKTYKNNPNIQKNSSKKYKEWCKNNPDKVKEKGEKLSRTLRSNPEIKIKQNMAMKKTLLENPNILKERGRKHSIFLRNRYKELFKKDSSIPYYLYIMKHLSKPIIKIGITMDISTRLSHINKDYGECSLVFQLGGNYENIFNSESFLHNYFEEYCRVQPSGSGKTEWFDVKIMEEAKLIASSRLLECE